MLYVRLMWMATIEADLIVMMRSAGSGGYLTADAFRYHDSSLELIAWLRGFTKRRM